MMHKPSLLVIVLLCCLLLGACAAPAASQVVSAPPIQERVLTDVRVQYRNATLIVEGVCEKTHIDTSGVSCCDVSVINTLAGNAKAGDILHCKNSSLKEGEQFVLFLKPGEDVHYAEDTASYELLTDKLLPVIDNEVIWDGQRLSLALLHAEIKELETVISAPASVFYYSDVTELAQAADEIFVGRVASLPALSKKPFTIRGNGTMEKAQYMASSATVEVYGSIKGALGGQYGQLIQMIDCPERIVNMQDADTLDAMSYALGKVPVLTENGIYLFFLMKSPDEKQNFYFPVNPIQGFVEIIGDDLHAANKNEPMLPYQTLKGATEALRRILEQIPAYTIAPPLVIGE